MQDLSLMAAGTDIVLLMEMNADAAHEPAGAMWFPPEFYEYFTLEQ